MRALSLNDLLSNAVSGLEAPVTLDLSSEDPVARLNLWLAQDALRGAIEFMAATKTVSSIRLAATELANCSNIAVHDHTWPCVGVTTDN